MAKLESSNGQTHPFSDPTRYRHICDHSVNSSGTIARENVGFSLEESEVQLNKHLHHGQNPRTTQELIDSKPHAEESISPPSSCGTGKYSFSDNVVAILLYALAFALAMGITDLATSIFEKFGGKRSTVKMNLIYVGILLILVVLMSGLFDRSFRN